MSAEVSLASARQNLTQAFPLPGPPWSPSQEEPATNDQPSEKQSPSDAETPSARSERATLGTHIFSGSPSFLMNCSYCMHSAVRRNETHTGRAVTRVPCVCVPLLSPPSENSCAFQSWHSHSYTCRSYCSASCQRGFS